MVDSVMMIDCLENTICSSIIHRHIDDKVGRLKFMSPAVSTKTPGEQTATEVRVEKMYLYERVDLKELKLGLEISI